jgi:hypothetical protein
MVLRRTLGKEPYQPLDAVEDQRPGLFERSEFSGRPERILRLIRLFAGTAQDHAHEPALMKSRV